MDPRISRASLTITLVFTSGIAAIAAPGGRIHVGPRVHVNASRARDPHNEVLLAIVESFVGLMLGPGPKAP